MGPEVLNAMKNFFDSIEKLKDLGVFRSEKFLGDIGEFIIQKLDNVKLCTNQKQSDIDGYLDGKPIQIKSHWGSERKNVNFGHPDKYEILFVVLGPKSRMRNACYTDNFLIYKFSSEEIKSNYKTKKNYSGGQKAFIKPPTHSFNFPT
jgi:hypothetical protein